MRIAEVCRAAITYVWRRVEILVRRLGRSWLDEYRLIARIWRGEYPQRDRKYPLSPLERFFMTILVFVRSFSLVRLADAFHSYRIRSALSESYVVLWLIILAVLLWYPIAPFGLLVCIVSYRLIDGFTYRLCILFVNCYKETRGLRSLNRTLLLLVFNFTEIVVGFAILFLNTASAGPEVGEAMTKPATALYFSVATITTLGFGDIRPVNDVGQWLVTAEVLLGFLFVVLVLTSFLTGIASIREIPPDWPEE